MAMSTSTQTDESPALGAVTPTKKLSICVPSRRPFQGPPEKGPQRAKAPLGYKSFTGLPSEYLAREHPPQGTQEPSAERPSVFVPGIPERIPNIRLRVYHLSFPLRLVYAKAPVAVPYHHLHNLAWKKPVFCKWRLCSPTFFAHLPVLDLAFIAWSVRTEHKGWTLPKHPYSTRRASPARNAPSLRLTVMYARLLQVHPEEFGDELFN